MSCLFQLLFSLRKRGAWIIAYSFLLLLFLAGCVRTTVDATTLNGKIHIAGSTALQPLVQHAAKDFVAAHPTVTLDVQGGGSFAGLDQLYAGAIDIGDSDVYADPTRYPDPDITDHLVAVVAFAMVIHPAVSVTNLTHQQIVDIYTGHITNWSELGGQNQPIKVIARPLSSGTRATFRKYILNSADEVPGVALHKDSSQELVDTVSQTPGAIGYVAVSAVTAGVHVVSIDNVMPTPQNVESGAYGFWSYEHMYTRGLPEGAVAAFLQFLLTASEQQVAASMGYIPISAMHTAQAPAR